VLAGSVHLLRLKSLLIMTVLVRIFTKKFQGAPSEFISDQMPNAVKN